MFLKDTYNIHKKIWCVFPIFKSKLLCKKGIHNYLLNPRHKIIPHHHQEVVGSSVISKTISYEYIDITNLKCLCCGKEEKLNK